MNLGVGCIQRQYTRVDPQKQRLSFSLGVRENCVRSTSRNLVYDKFKYDAGNILQCQEASGWVQGVQKDEFLTADACMMMLYEWLSIPHIPQENISFFDWI